MFRRFDPSLLLHSVAAGALLFGPSFASPRSPQAQDLVGQADSLAGLSLDESFFDEINDAYLVPQNAGIVSIARGDEFESHFNNFNTLAASIPGIDLAELISTLVAGTPWGAEIEAVMQILSTACGGGQLSLRLEVPLDSVRRGYTFVQSDPQVVTLPDGRAGLRFTVELSRIGAIYDLRTVYTLGSFCQFLSYDHAGYEGFSSGTYQVLLTRDLASGELEVNAELESLGPRTSEVPKLSGIENFLVVLINALGGVIDQIFGNDFEQLLQQWAETQVPLELEAVFERLAGPLFPAEGQFALAPDAQVFTRLREQLHGDIGDPVFRPAEVQHRSGRIERAFTKRFSLVQGTPLGCADPVTTFVDHPDAQPPWDGALGGGEGTALIDFVSWEHVLTGADLEGLGSRGHVIPMTRVVPELRSWTIGPALTDPNSPAYPVTISAAQANAYAALANSLPGGGPLIGGLDLAYSICPIETEFTFFPRGTGVGPIGLVTREVSLQVSLGSSDDGVSLTEDLHAVFEGDLFLRHDTASSPRLNSMVIEVGDVRAISVASVQPDGSELDVASIDGSTPVSAAPVTIFLKALLGDPSLNDGPDDRMRLLYEGLCAPSVARAVQGVVRLPSVDFGPLGIDPFVVDPQANTDEFQSYLGEELDVGWRLDVPRLCASVIEAWGEEGSLPPGTLGPDPFLVIEIDWTPGGEGWLESKSLGFANLQVATDPDFDRNPSRRDDAFVAFVHDSQPGHGESSRVLYAGGELTSAAFFGGGLHHVAATIAGYQRARTVGLGDPHATFEWDPYLDADGSPCGLLVPFPTDPPPDGSHHAAAPAGPWLAAVAAESLFSCARSETCRGVRFVWVHTEPLFQECAGSVWFGQDADHLILEPDRLRDGPDDYGYLPCAGGPGEVDPPGGSIGGTPFD